MKLLGDSKDVNTLKVLIVANYCKIDLDFREDPKIPAEKNPYEKAPVLETETGCVYGTNAVVRYVSRLGNKLYGNNIHEAGLCDQYMETANEIALPANVWLFPIFGYIPNNPQATQKAKGDIRKSLEILNKTLATRTFLVNERITLADVVMSLTLLPLFEKVLDPSFRKSFPNTTRWFQTCVNQPEFKHILRKDVVLCEKAEVAKEAPAAEHKEKEQKPKKEAPKKEEKKEEKKEAPKKKKDEDEEEEADEFADEKPKGKNPLDLLPPSPFIMDEWKRMYSNEDDTRGVACKWFWEKFDKEGYSLWIGNYKYNEELQKIFMTCNFVNGYIQRLDRLRKYGFGSFVIFGDEGKMEIACAFLVRGQELPPEMTEAEDTELYAWRKVDSADAASRELIDDFWAWSGSFGGRALPFNQGKIFK